MSRRERSILCDGSAREREEGGLTFAVLIASSPLSLAPR